MSPSQQLATAVNFAAEYYSLLVTNPAALAPSYHASCTIERAEKSHTDAAAYFGGLTAGNFRVVISDVSVNDNATTKTGINFTVTASNVFNKSGTPSAQFTQTLEIVKHNGGYYVAVDKQVAVTCSPVASAFAAFSATAAKKAPAKQPASARPSAAAKAEKAQAAEPEKPAAPMMSGVNWSEDTPPAFAAQPKEMPPPMPMEETPASSPPKSAPSTAAPSPAAPAKAKAKPTPKKEAAPAKPAAEPKAAEAPKPKAAEEKPAAPAPAAAAPAPQEKPAKAEPKAPLSFADRVRGGAAPAPAPKPVAEAAKPAEEAKPAEPEAVPAPKPAEPTTAAAKPAPKPKAEEAAPAPAPAAAPAAAAVEEAKPAAATEAPAAPAKAEEEKPKGNAWSRGPLTFSKDEQMKPVVPKPAPVVEKPSTPAPEETPAKADAKPARPAAATGAAGAGGRPLSSTVQHYHVFVRGLPTGCTDEDLYELMSKHVPMTRSIKVDSKVVQETVRPSNDLVNRTRTFAFVCLDCSKAEVPTHIATLKSQRLSMGPGAGTMHFDEVHDKAAFSPAGGAAGANRSAGAGAARPRK